MNNNSNNDYPYSSTNLEDKSEVVGPPISASFEEGSIADETVAPVEEVTLAEAPEPEHETESDRWQEADQEAAPSQTEKRKPRRRESRPRTESQEQQLKGRKSLCKRIPSIASNMMKQVKLRILSTEPVNDLRHPLAII